MPFATPAATRTGRERSGIGAGRVRPVIPRRSCARASARRRSAAGRSAHGRRGRAPAGRCGRPGGDSLARRPSGQVRRPRHGGPKRAGCRRGATRPCSRSCSGRCAANGLRCRAAGAPRGAALLPPRPPRPVLAGAGFARAGAGASAALGAAAFGGSSATAAMGPLVRRRVGAERVERVTLPVDLAADQALDLADMFRVVGCDDAEGHAAASRAAGAADAMNVILGVDRHVEIEDVADVGNVEAARGHVGTDDAARPRRSGTRRAKPCAPAGPCRRAARRLRNHARRATCEGSRRRACGCRR